MGKGLGKCMRVVFTEGGDSGWLLRHCTVSQGQRRWAPTVPLIVLLFTYFCMQYDCHGLANKASEHHLLLHRDTSGRQRSSGVLLKHRGAGELTQKHTRSLRHIRDANIVFLCLRLILALGTCGFFLQKQKKQGWLLVTRSQNFNNALFLSKCADYLVTLDLLIEKQNEWDLLNYLIY